MGSDGDTPAETASISGTVDLAGGNLGHGITRQTLALNAGAVLRISGNASTFPNFASDNTGTADDDVYSINATSTVQYTELGAQTIAGATFNTIFNGTYGNLLVSGTGSKTLASGNVSVQGDLTVTSSTPGTVASSILDIAGSTINRTAAGGTLTVDAGAALRIGGTTNVFPTNYSTVDLDPTSTVEYYGTGAQSVVVRTYGHLTLSGGNTKTAAGALIVAGNFLISAGTTFAAGAFTHEFRGNFTNNGNLLTVHRHGPVQRSGCTDHRRFHEPHDRSATSPSRRTLASSSRLAQNVSLTGQPDGLRWHAQPGAPSPPTAPRRAERSRWPPARCSGWAEPSHRSRRTSAR